MSLNIYDLQYACYCLPGETGKMTSGLSLSTSVSQRSYYYEMQGEQQIGYF